MRRRASLGATLLLVFAAVAALSGCQAILDPEVTPSPVPSSGGASGIRGTVHLGPTCEGATRASPCIEPYAAALLILDAEEDVVAELVSGVDGTFEVALPPGIYTVQPVPPENGDQFPAAQPLSVVVGEGEYTEVGIDYDTGIR